MKRLATLLPALVVLATLLGSCGGDGEEEAAVLAVAFRLDEGSPAMSAYIGDPTRDPFELPAGRYYIEAVDQDDVVISLGSVDIEDDDVVDFPAYFEAAGGVADGERAEPLITLASFLIDVELAEYTFLEIVTGGFSESPFDPALELQTADFDGLLEMYDEIAAQEEAVMAALSEVEGRAEVSLGVLYVRSPWAPAPQLFGGCHQAVSSYYDSLHGCEADGGLVGFDAVRLETCEPLTWRTREEIEEIELRAQAYEREHEKWERAEDAGRRLRELQGEWGEYASGLAGPGGRAALEERIRRDLGALLSAEDDPARARVRDRLTESFVNRVALENPQLRRTATPTPSPTPIATPTATPAPTPTPIPEETPTPVETPVTTPEATETPTPEATETPTPEAQEVTAVGEFVDGVEPNCVVPEKGITLRFNTGGGPVSGEGHVRRTCVYSEGCPESLHEEDWYFEGTYSPGSETSQGTFSGTVQWSWQSIQYRQHGDTPEYGPDGKLICDSIEATTDEPITAPWEATLEGQEVTGSITLSLPEWGLEEVVQFRLTVQG